jgi:hypothetical protein
MSTNFCWLHLSINMCALIYVPVSIMCRHFVVYVATPGWLALATVLRLVDCNVTHDVTLFCVGSPSTRNIRRQHVKKVHKITFQRDLIVVRLINSNYNRQFKIFYLMLFQYFKLLIILCIKIKWFFAPFVCFFAPYTNPHFWADLNQNLHTSPPSSGVGRRVYMDPQYLTRFDVFVIFCQEPIQNTGHKPASPRVIATALYQ